MQSRNQGTGNGGLANFSAIAARKKNLSAGAVPAVFRSVTTVSKRISGESATAPPGFARIVNGSG